ncbi:ABC transporter substrate-binding protein [Rivihabitans pingtungensis]|jgi:iron complex transport system substrate-binding protein|uniref:Iron complex transport system substrate-binding protein n=2 Tax=Rivihabitans pingtungensis TaxID=1054498 RepID=A0A318KW86_9NEIS|nr:ABC transporter substrate-binding protein [Rivihabitans pingtungensis]PXX82081.1 iron complex transport system substrate-binding protein [Rivihabitans pingtungensis]
MSHYQRIACLCTEAVDTLYALGAEEHIAGISGFTVHPPRAREEKPKISGFSSGKIERILSVEPDLVVGYSSLQAELCKDLSKAGVEVLLFNHRTISGILRMVRVLAALVEKEKQGNLLEITLHTRLDVARTQAKLWDLAGWRRPVVYFEEWHEPLTTGIGWVSELIQLAGGVDAFAELSQGNSAKERKIDDAQEVIRRQPDIIIGSWCGRAFDREALMARPGWADIPAVRMAADGMVCEIKSSDILAPGPAAIQHGLSQLQQLIGRWHARHHGTLAE